MRCYTDVILTTAKILRDEQCYFDDEIYESEFDLTPEQYFGKDGKPIAIMTRNLGLGIIKSNPIFSDKRFKKIILSKPSNLQRFVEFKPEIKLEWKEKYNTEILGVENTSVPTCVSFLRDHLKYQ